MSEMLNAVVGYPGVVATVMLGVVLAYWLFVMFGALDIDLFSGDGAAEGAAKGVLEGVSKGAMDGLADGAIHGGAKGVAEGLADGVADGAIDGAADGAADGAVDGSVEGASKAAAEAAADGASDGVAKAVGASKAAGGHAVGANQATVDLLSMANFRSVPVTVMLSVVVCFTWLFCVAGSRSVQGMTATMPLPWWLIGTLILVLSFLVALVPTALAIRPMSRFFVVHQATRHADLVGKVCVVSTGKVDARFGQATLQSDGMSLLIQVRNDGGAKLKKGDGALIVSWDGKRGAFLVEPYEEMMNGG